MGPLFAAFTGVAFKEGVCYGKPECAVLFFLTPALLIGEPLSPSRNPAFYCCTHPDLAFNTLLNKHLMVTFTDVPCYMSLWVTRTPPCPQNLLQVL